MHFRISIHLWRRSFFLSVICSFAHLLIHPFTSMTESMNDTTTHTSTIASLYIDALRHNQSLWFRVASNSMLPLLRKDDEVFIEPALAQTIVPGDIAAFETAQGLVIHRIVAIERIQQTSRLLQMSDVEVSPTWVQPQAIVGRVVMVRRGKRQLNLRHPLARWASRVTAAARYRLYIYTKNTPLRLALRIASRLAIHLGDRCIRFCCISQQ